MLKPQIELDAAPGIHRIEDAHTNWYLVVDVDRLCVVDTGFPGSWRSLEHALRKLGRRLEDIEAVVLTHGHFDHLGFAARAQRELDVPVWAPQGEDPVGHPWRYEHERSRLPYFRHPTFARIFAEMSALGAPLVRGVSTARRYEPGETLDVPGRPKAIGTPGHTIGHCSLFYEDRGAVIAGDAFVMLDPYTGRRGPCIVAGAATADSERALVSLDGLAQFEARLGLTGHGPAWRGSLAEAAERARAAGPA